MVHSSSEVKPSQSGTIPGVPATLPLVALVGSANSGKTTLFNQLTGSNYTTVNYPGATVEFALGMGKMLPGLPCRVMDTPGLTSLIPASPDEKVTVDALFEGSNRPDKVVAVVDGNQLSRHLYLVKQLQDLDLKPVVVLTMSDLLAAKGKRINIQKLSQVMDLPVVALDPRRKQGIPELQRLLTDNDCGCAAPDRKTRSDYAQFSKEMNEERIHAYYRALDEIESLVMEDIVSDDKTSTPKVFDPHALDRWLLHPFYGLALFIASMFVIFTAIFWFAAPFMDLIDLGFGLLIDTAKDILPASWLTDMFADGLIGGIGAVLVFLPQIVILFLAMGYLEDSGYLARGAALVDRPLSKIGLNGKSFVPLLSGYACAIPAMMAARTIPNRFERNLTIFIIPLMSCSARLPVYALLLAFITPKDKPWIGGLGLTALYFMGMVMGAAVSSFISRFRKNRTNSGFILELPALRHPMFTVVISSTFHKASQYIRKAGLTIVIISLSLWVLTHTPIPSPSEVGANNSELSSEYVAVSNSYAAQIGKFIEPITRPMGLDWRGGVALISGFAAREVFVSALVLMYHVDDQDEDGLTTRLLSTMSEVRFMDTGEPIFTLSSVLGMALFFMIALQCFPTVAVARQETGAWRIPILQLVVYTGGAYVLTVLLVQGLRAFGVP